MKNIFFISFLFFFSTSAVCQNPGMKKLVEMTDEIILIEVVKDSSYFIVENFKCIAIIKADIKYIYKSKKVSVHRKKLEICHRAICENGVFPNSKKLSVGRKYVVFLNTSNVNGSELEDYKSNKVIFSLSDDYLGVQVFDEDIDVYLKSN